MSDTLEVLATLWILAIIACGIGVFFVIFKKEDTERNPPIERDYFK